MSCPVERAVRSRVESEKNDFIAHTNFCRIIVTQHKKMIKWRSKTSFRAYPIYRPFGFIRLYLLHIPNGSCL